jgi:hypothetical protein
VFGWFRFRKSAEIRRKVITLDYWLIAYVGENVVKLALKMSPFFFSNLSIKQIMLINNVNKLKSLNDFTPVYYLLEKASYFTH